MSKRKAADDHERTAKKYLQNYKDSYKEIWPFFNKSQKGDQYVRCSICEMDFTCAHGGKNDCRRHVQSKSHQDFQKLKASNRSMQSFCTKKSQTETDRVRAVTKAEAFQCQMIADMNLSLASADTMTRTFKQMFPDSKVAAG